MQGETAVEQVDASAMHLPCGQHQPLLPGSYWRLHTTGQVARPGLAYVACRGSETTQIMHRTAHR